MLFKSFVAVKVHFVDRGKSQQTIKVMLKVFISNSIAATLANVTVPTSQSLYERFKNIVANQCRTMRVAQASPCVEEDLPKRIQLVKNIVLELDDKAKQKLVKRHQRKVKNKELQETGLRIRAQAISIISNGL